MVQDAASYYSTLSVVPVSGTAKGVGEYTLQAVATRRLTDIDLAFDYMQLVFADETVTYLQFKLYVAQGTLSYVRKQFQTSTTKATQNQQYLKIEWSETDGCYLVKIGRGAYEQYAKHAFVQEYKNCFTIGLYAAQSVSNLGTYYIDDFEAISGEIIAENAQG